MTDAYGKMENGKASAAPEFARRNHNEIRQVVYHCRLGRRARDLNL
jgi:hypothetical protein